MKVFLLAALVAFASAQQFQEQEKLDMEEFVQEPETVSVLPSPEEVTQGLEDGTFTKESVDEVEHSRVAVVCKCKSKHGQRRMEEAKKSGKDFGVTINFKEVSIEEAMDPEFNCALACGDEPPRKDNRRQKRQVGFGGLGGYGLGAGLGAGLGGYGGFGWGGYFNGLPVGYGNLGFNLMGAGAQLGLGGCGLSCNSAPCGGMPIDASMYGLGAAAMAPIPAMGFDSFGASLGFGAAGIGNAHMAAANVFGGFGLGLGQGMCFGCQRNWMPAVHPVSVPVPHPVAVPHRVPVPHPIAIPHRVAVPHPVAVPRYVDVPVPRHVAIPVPRPVSIPVPRPVNVIRRVDVPVVRQVNVARPVAVPMPVRVAAPVPVRRVIQVRRVLRLRPMHRVVKGVVAIPVSGLAMQRQQMAGGMIAGGMSGMSVQGLSGLAGAQGLAGLSGARYSYSSGGAIPVPMPAASNTIAAGANAAANAAYYSSGMSTGGLTGSYSGYAGGVQYPKTQKTN